ncbi:GntR family transcriptional regulator [Mesobacterium pallidum]|uniref:GntR family transcriptional regulator n=1 Tax=Mesobacterium pallidum TaxID=2872037 RepID=UPI001EE2231E|nr:FCD domain-containing protein [Mesobacterium pallidum]
MLESPAPTLTDQAHAALRRDIVSGRLAPGTRLRIARLSEDYAIGASPLREALSRLSAEFLVTVEGQRGFAVAPISAQDLRDISQMRCEMECEALARAIAAGDDGWEAGIVAAFYALEKSHQRRQADPEATQDEWEDRNRAFHEALVAACDSTWLRRFRDMLYAQHERYRRISRQRPDAPRDVQAEHRAILEAVLARDTARACAATKSHLDRTTQAVLAVIDTTEKDT